MGMNTVNKFLRWQLAALALVALLSVNRQMAQATGSKTKTSFTIEASQDVGCWGSFGKFRVSGAVKDHGRAVTSYSMYPDYDLVLDGQRGSILIVIEDGMFLVADATGEHVGLIGAMGTADADWNITDGYDLNGDCSFGTVRWTLKGLLP